jgi:alcohol dehydrogenase class IV
LAKNIALDGIRRVIRYLPRAVDDGSNIEARGEMMLAAFAGGVSIGMGLGPAHAVAITCSDQGFHHGILSGIGLIATIDATAAHVPDQMAPVIAAFGLPAGSSLALAVATLMHELNLPTSLAELGYAAGDLVTMAAAAERSHFNLSAPFRPNASQYAVFLAQSLQLENIA